MDIDTNKATYIKKREGQEVPFELSKIGRAIFRAREETSSYRTMEECLLEAQAVHNILLSKDSGP